jgi:hypothetical protein
VSETSITVASMEGHAATALVPDAKASRRGRLSDSEIIVAEPGSARRNWSDPIRHRGRPAREEPAPRKAGEGDESEEEESKRRKKPAKMQDKTKPSLPMPKRTPPCMSDHMCAHPR